MTHMMEDDSISPSTFADVYQRLQDQSNFRKNDERAWRLAALSNAIMETIDTQTTTRKNNESCADAPPLATQVYAKTVTALEGTMDQVTDTSTSTRHSEEIVESNQLALLELLLYTIPHVTPVAILSASLVITSRLLRTLVKFHTMTQSSEMSHQDPDTTHGNSNALCRWAAQVTAALLVRLPNATDQKMVHQLLQETLILLFADGRPKVRKVAHNALFDVFTTTTTIHAAIGQTTIRHIQQQLRSVQDDSLSNQRLHQLLLVLPFVERVIGSLHKSYNVGAQVMECLAVLLQVPVSGTAAMSDFVASPKLQQTTPKILTIQALLSVVSVLLTTTRQNELIVDQDDFPARVLASLLQTQPTLIFCKGAASMEALAQTKITYGQVVLLASGLCLDHQPTEVAFKLVPLAVQLVVRLSCPMADDPEDNSNKSFVVAETLMLNLIQFVRSDLSLSTLSSRSFMDDVLRAMAQILEPAYRQSWSVSLKCLVAVIHQEIRSLQNLTSSNLASQDLIQETLDRLVDLHNEAPAEVEDALSSLIQAVGVESFWQWMHFQSCEQPNDYNKLAGIAKDRAWVLSTIRSASSVAQEVPPRLAFFESSVLGLARICDKLAATGPTSESKFHHQLVVNLWALFPSFCKCPSDIESALSTLTTTLGRALDDNRYPELLAIICNGLTMLVTELDESGGLELDTALGDVSSVASASVKLLPLLFKFVSDFHSAHKTDTRVTTAETDNSTSKPASRPADDFQKLQSVTTAISSLARLAPADFLRALFQKLMHRHLEEIQNESGSSERTCSLLTLSQALVTAKVLDESSIDFLYRALKPLIRNDEYGPRVQKRSYKVLAEICEKHHSYFEHTDRLKELSVLLTGTILTSQISARQMRLKCMQIIVDGLDETNDVLLKEIHKVTAEILLCLKDSNGKSREIAYQLLLSISSKGNLVEFVQVIVAALAAASSQMRSAAILALSRIVFEKAWDDNELLALLPSLLQMVLLLIDEGSREVIKSVVGFVRISVAAIPPMQLEPLVPEILKNLLKSNHTKSRFRGKIKIILKKFVKLFGYEKLMQFIPESESRLLTHMRKLDEREKRRRDTQKVQRQQAQVRNFDEMLDSDEDDSDDGRTLVTGATSLSRTSRLGNTVGSKTIASTVLSSNSMPRSLPKLLLPDETDGEVVDMLGSKMVKRVHFARDDGKSDSDSDCDAMEFNDEGKFIVRLDEFDDKAETQAQDGESVSRGNSKKRRLSKLDATKISRNESVKSKAKKCHLQVSLGSAYKSKKAGGDVQKKGQKFEPYAFVPLDGRAFSKKNRKTAVEQMSSVVRKGKRKR